MFATDSNSRSLFSSCPSIASIRHPEQPRVLVVCDVIKNLSCKIINKKLCYSTVTRSLPGFYLLRLCMRILRSYEFLLVNPNSYRMCTATSTILVQYFDLYWMQNVTLIITCTNTCRQRPHNSFTGMQIHEIVKDHQYLGLSQTVFICIIAINLNWK